MTSRASWGLTSDKWGAIGVKNPENPLIFTIFSNFSEKISETAFLTRVDVLTLAFCFLSCRVKFNSNPLLGHTTSDYISKLWPLGLHMITMPTMSTVGRNWQRKPVRKEKRALTQMCDTVFNENHNDNSRIKLLNLWQLFEKISLPSLNFEMGGMSLPKNRFAMVLVGLLTDTSTLENNGYITLDSWAAIAARRSGLPV